MTRQTKRWLCWGPAIGLFAIYVLALMGHWIGGWDIPPGTHTIVNIAVVVLILAGRDLGRERPVLLYMQADEPEVRRQRRRHLEPAHTDGTPFADRIQRMLEEGERD